MLKFGLVLVLSWFYLFVIFVKLINLNGLYNTFYLQGIEAYIEMEVREGRPLFYNDTTFADMTKLRIKKINRTTHVFIGNASSFVDIGNDYTVNKFI